MPPCAFIAPAFDPVSITTVILTTTFLVMFFYSSANITMVLLVRFIARQKLIPKLCGATLASQSLLPDPTW
uniref:Uncharacterized protein n=1 Tax=Ciona intestinalis TaxID=7719 RepID=H2XZP9_CIOIN